MEFIMAKKQQTTREKRLAKIAQLEAQLQKEKARLNEEKRKERNGQLIAFGVFLEEYLKDKPGRIPSMKQTMQRLLDGRNLDRALAGVSRIEEWLKQNEKALEEILVEENWSKNFSGSPKREISPEPPSQLPEAEAQEKNQGSA